MSLGTLILEDIIIPYREMVSWQTSPYGDWTLPRSRLQTERSVGYQKEDRVVYNLFALLHMFKVYHYIEVQMEIKLVFPDYTVHYSLDVGISFKPEKHPFSGDTIIKILYTKQLSFRERD